MELIFKTWYVYLLPIIKNKYFIKLLNKYDELYNLSKYKFNNVNIYPHKNKVFSCFNCDFNNVKVVIIGSKPFENYSEGLAFDSTNDNIDVSIYSSIFYKNIEKYYGLKLDHDFTLKYLEEQGVLLLNESLINSNKLDDIQEWKLFITFIINTLQKHHTGIIYCINKNSDLKSLINLNNNYIIEYDDMDDYLHWKKQHLWDLDLKLINEIINKQNGKEYEIKF